MDELTGATRSIAQVLDEARARLRRLDPHEVAQAMERGALLIDIRPFDQRRREGEVPGALIIERNVLEWRLDPSSDTHIPNVESHDQQVIVMCSESYTSSLAAVALQDLGFASATDMAGGFLAWERAGLPTVKAG